MSRRHQGPESKTRLVRRCERAGDGRDGVTPPPFTGEPPGVLDQHPQLPTHQSAGCDQRWLFDLRDCRAVPFRLDHGGQPRERRPEQPLSDSAFRCSRSRSRLMAFRRFCSCALRDELVEPLEGGPGPGTARDIGGREGRQSGTRLGRHPAGVHERGQAVAGPQGQLLPAEEPRGSLVVDDPHQPAGGDDVRDSSKTAGCPAVRMRRGFGAGPGDNPAISPRAQPSTAPKSSPRARGRGQFDEPGGAGVEDPRLGPPTAIRATGSSTSIRRVPYTLSPTPARSRWIEPRSPSRRPAARQRRRPDPRPQASRPRSRRATRGRCPPVPAAGPHRQGLPRSRGSSCLASIHPAAQRGVANRASGPSRTPDQATVEPPGAVKSVVGTTLNDLPSLRTMISSQSRMVLRRWATRGSYSPAAGGCRQSASR